ncbi:MAG: hypothetical protein CSA52_02275 [Gammaproteobacteria bacterium]|nr:MAG: hypothetical protein CSB48_06260 [Pseudomonadota bacterium]PIE38417.1 MAG: hypothetical protein CSA52_02275 [Gammaproteobacteria bacterium]
MLNFEATNDDKYIVYSAMEPDTMVKNRLENHPDEALTLRTKSIKTIIYQIVIGPSKTKNVRAWHFMQ